MRYLRMYNEVALNDRDIIVTCSRLNIFDYTINDDKSIDVNGDIRIIVHISYLPLKFRYVYGNFTCDYSSLTTLKNCPQIVNGNFNCYNNDLTNLEYSPTQVDGYFDCGMNKITSLKGCTQKIGGDFNCFANELTSLIGCPKSVGGDFSFARNQVSTFEGLDFIHIGNRFNSIENPIWAVWKLFKDHTKFEFFNYCDIIREDRVIILDRLNFFLDYIGKETVKDVIGYRCI